VFRRAAMRIAEGAAQRVRIDVADLPEILGPRRFESEVAMRTSVPGVATGLAWTPMGGDILFIEATRVPGSGRLILTGQLGDVMKESAQAALSLVKSKARARHRGRDPREERHPRPRARGCDPQGRAERRRRHVRRARLAADRPQGA
jgi:ATP-dependent Lon protease